MSSPVPGCPCHACLNPTHSGHDVLMLAEAFAGTSLRMPSGQMCEMLTDTWKMSPMCPWVHKSASVQSGTTPVAATTGAPDLLGKVTIAPAIWKGSDVQYEQGRNFIIKRLIQDLDTERQRLLGIFPNFGGPLAPNPAPNPAPDPAPEPTPAPAEKYTDADVLKLTELLLEGQRKGRFNGSMHDLATKLLKGLYGD